MPIIVAYGSQKITTNRGDSWMKIAFCFRKVLTTIIIILL
jgi:hypothetical protein